MVKAVSLKVELKSQALQPRTRLPPKTRYRMLSEA